LKDIGCSHLRQRGSPQPGFWNIVSIGRADRSLIGFARGSGMFADNTGGTGGAWLAVPKHGLCAPILAAGFVLSEQKGMKADGTSCDANGMAFASRRLTENR
jgi:hypothetical protein